MINLEQISTMDFIRNYLSRDEQKEFLKNGITNYQKLEQFFLSHPEWKDTILERHLIKAKRRINDGGFKSDGVIYDIPLYSDDSLVYTDELVTGDILMLNNPWSTNRGFTNSLTNISIAEIKHRLTHLNLYLKNYFEAYPPMNATRARKVRAALYLYNAQIERQALETDQRDINLFTYMAEEKRNLIKHEIRDIISWLVENTEEAFVWGELTEPQKDKYLSALVNDFMPDVFLRDNLIEYISNYVTYSEAKNGLTNGDSLKRFILK